MRTLPIGTHLHTPLSAQRSGLMFKDEVATKKMLDALDATLFDDLIGRFKRIEATHSLIDDQGQRPFEYMLVRNRLYERSPRNPSNFERYSDVLHVYIIDHKFGQSERFKPEQLLLMSATGDPKPLDSKKLLDRVDIAAANLYTHYRRSVDTNTVSEVLQSALTHLVNRIKTFLKPLTDAMKRVLIWIEQLMANIQAFIHNLLKRCNGATEMRRSK